MSIEGQGHFFTIYFPGFVCFVLYLAKISGERLQDHWSSGIFIYLPSTTLFKASVNKGATSTIFNAFGMVRQGHEPTTYRPRSGHSNHYSIGAGITQCCPVLEVFENFSFL